jgi:hypothetical protein
LSTDSMDGRIFWFLVNLALGNFCDNLSSVHIGIYYCVYQVGYCLHQNKDSSLCMLESV